MILNEGPRSLFRRTATTVAAVLMIFQLILVAATVNFVMLPMAKRSADDLSALLVLSAQTWVELPPETRKDFELELLQKHQFILFVDMPPLPPRESFWPYLTLLDSALSARTGEPISVKETKLDTTWYWAEMHMGGELIRIGFPKERLDTDPPATVILALIAMVMLTLLTALILARRITKPLAQLSLAAEKIGEGKIPEALPESGIRELAGLAQTFNQMALKLQQLLANRTTMLAGISHDLRTPLARMNVAIEMLPEDTNPDLISRLRHDIESMNQLIGEFLLLSRDDQHKPVELIDVNRLLDWLVEDAIDRGAEVIWRSGEQRFVSANAMLLRRVLENLLGNAIRYGRGKPLEVVLDQNDQNVMVRILDSGTGIPPEEVENVFRPFYRLESSRSAKAGGSGLGLAIVRQIADASGWTVELLPRFGGGTEARLTIPRLAAAE